MRALSFHRAWPIWRQNIGKFVDDDFAEPDLTAHVSSTGHVAQFLKFTLLKQTTVLSSVTQLPLIEDGVKSTELMGAIPLPFTCRN